LCEPKRWYAPSAVTACEKFLRDADALEALHLALPPAGRLMRIPGAIVLRAPAHMAARDPEIIGRYIVRPRIARDQSPENEDVILQKLSHQFQRGVLRALD
jgi:hypothetical protein